LAFGFPAIIMAPNIYELAARKQAVQSIWEQSEPLPIGYSLYEAQTSRPEVHGGCESASRACNAASDFPLSRIFELQSCIELHILN
jgi:hypothetical protein